MKKMTAIAALSLAAILPFASVPAFAGSTDTQTTLCSEAPRQAEKAGIDCTTTATTPSQNTTVGKQYPSGPVNFGSGVVF